MEMFHEYLEKLEQPEHRTRVEEVLTWVGTTFPELKPIIAWNEPMFSHHDTFIIGFSVAKHHMAVSPEVAGITKFEEEINWVSSFYYCYLWSTRNMGYIISFYVGTNSE